MMRSTLVLTAVLGIWLVTACDKPATEDCRKALVNMQLLLGTDNLSNTATLEGEVRRCKGGSKKDAVACAIKATTLDELRHCEFYKVPDRPGVGSGTARCPRSTRPSCSPAC